MNDADVENDARYEPFIEFHDYLLKTYPKMCDFPSFFFPKSRAQDED